MLTSYDLLRRDHEDLAAHSWGLVIADEAQKIKNSGTLCARSARALSSVTRLALTGVSTTGEN